MVLLAAFIGPPAVEMHLTPRVTLKNMTWASPGFIIRRVVLCVFLCGAAMAQTPGATGTPPHAGQLNAEQVVKNLTRMNLARAQSLHSYQSTRIYRLEYKGFPGGRTAEMVVTAKYQAPGTKEFEIVSSTGSKVVIDRVFKKLLESEKEAFETENQKRIAINQENYEFTLAGYENSPRGPAYVLSLNPKTKNKFLFRGKIWVDAEQFAIVRIEGEPAKNPSFWIKGTKIETLYVNVNDFWLPAHNHSITAVRLGGHADLSIEYKDYRTSGTSPSSKVSSASEPSR
jgi:outer membrane lipoprotein-sorting protein